MSNKNKDTSGPAFPVPLNEGERWAGPGNCCGMTLRDWFAGLAMQGMYANQTFDYREVEEIAETAYMQADAMLDVRKEISDE
jgi:hypothetical protein